MATYKRSEAMGMSKSYLSVYRSTRNMPKGSSTKEVVKAFTEEKQDQEQVLNGMIEMYYSLKDKKKMLEFGKHLCNIGLYISPSCVYRISESLFKNTVGLRHKSAIEDWKKVSEEFKGWRESNNV